MTPRSRVRMPPRRLDQLLSIGFLLFWLLPITYVGLLGETVGFAPDAVKPLYHIACLFADRASTHANFYYQVQLRGSKRWVSVPESDLSRLKPYNYSRVHLYLNRLPNSEGSELRRRKLAEFIRARHSELHPEQPPVMAARILLTVFEPGDPRLANPSCGWERPPFAEVDPDDTQVWSTYRFGARARPGKGAGAG
jgi:hypothetical protein